MEFTVSQMMRFYEDQLRRKITEDEQEAVRILIEAVRRRVAPDHLRDERVLPGR